MVTLLATVNVKCRFYQQIKRLKTIVSILVDTTAIVALHVAPEFR
ncbi:hypothetical protein BTN49_2042 [Candidatus Enterovibrio escicola]|uniref:Uncharacterized protein n=1 Tax=Candidatus Enterovibrio escicola TaxID=1927127 RepID=A0A2A5T2B6_9GAMM|nr:hypothetical protein BTN49_2042 [Candidatus Enterovibrio escacola]